MAATRGWDAAWSRVPGAQIRNDSVIFHYVNTMGIARLTDPITPATGPMTWQMRTDQGIVRYGVISAQCASCTVWNGNPLMWVTGGGNCEWQSCVGRKEVVDGAPDSSLTFRPGDIVKMTYDPVSCHLTAEVSLNGTDQSWKTTRKLIGPGLETVYPCAFLAIGTDIAVTLISPPAAAPSAVPVAPPTNVHPNAMKAMEEKMAAMEERINALEQIITKTDASSLCQMCLRRKVFAFRGFEGDAAGLGFQMSCDHRFCADCVEWNDVCPLCHEQIIRQAQEGHNRPSEAHRLAITNAVQQGNIAEAVQLSVSPVGVSGEILVNCVTHLCREVHTALATPQQGGPIGLLLGTDFLLRQALLSNLVDVLRWAGDGGLQAQDRDAVPVIVWVLHGVVMGAGEDLGRGALRQVECSDTLQRTRTQLHFITGSTTAFANLGRETTLAIGRIEHLVLEMLE